MLKDLMMQKNISVKELSEQSGIPYSTINSLCNGTRDIYKCEMGSCYKIASALGVTINEFYDWCVTGPITDNAKDAGCEDYSLKMGENKLQDIYHMSRDTNISLAKRNIIDSIYKSAKLEGLGVTFAQTEVIYNSGVVNGVKMDDIIAVNNLKHAWQFILDTVDYPMDILYLRQINKEIGDGIIHRAGDIRNDSVGMGGTKWIPEIPNYDTVSERINTIMQSDRTSTDKAITMFLYICRQQPFFDGNKRTATIAANQMLIADGKGIISIPEELDTQFKTLLVEYYETNDMETVKKFLYEKCLDGYGLTKDTPQPEINKELFYLKTDDTEEDIEEDIEEDSCDSRGDDGGRDDI